MNAVRVRTRKFIAFTNKQKQKAFNIDDAPIEEMKLQVVEVDFSKPSPAKI